jgi:hypothetical protein
MYLFLTGPDTKHSPFAPTHTAEKPLTTADIYDNFSLSGWSAHKVPNYRPEGTAVPESFYIEKRLDSPSGLPTKILNPYVNTQYQIIQYTQGLKWMDYFIQEQLVALDSALYINDTTMAITVVPTQDGFDDEVIQDDAVTTYLVLSLGHGPNARRMLGFTTIRAVCANTLAMGQVQSLANLSKHFTLTGPGSLQQAKEALDLTQQEFTQSMDLYKHWANTPISAFQKEALFEIATGIKDPSETTKMQQRTLDALERAYRESPGMEIFGTDCNAWRLYNSVTWVADHIGSDDLKRYSNTQGMGNAMRRRTHNVLLEMAK